MDKEVGIGLMIGLLTFSSIYVWKSNSFSKVQKTILLICILFAPLQWIGIIFFLTYNKMVFENSRERIAEKKAEENTIKLNSSIENLKDLKEKGILTEEEFNQKIYKIKSEKENQTLKNSSEYKQLKSLFDSGILSIEEFENKIQQIKESKFIVNGCYFVNGYKYCFYKNGVLEIEDVYKNLEKGTWSILDKETINVNIGVTNTILQNITFNDDGFSYLNGKTIFNAIKCD